MAEKHPYFGPKLKWYRDQRQLTQRALAKQAGVSWSLISAYERCEANPQYPTTSRIAEALGIHVSTLWDHTPPPTDPPHPST
jgi:transcriptional regulator with XRE-family HTH domain